MNIWRHGRSLNQNPYARTAFRVARVPREITRRRTVIQLINQTRKIIETDPQAHVIAGQAVTRAELNVAEQILQDARRRILEELLEHAAEQPPVEQVRKLAGEVAAAMSADPGPLPVKNLVGLLPWAGCWAQQFLDNAPEPEASFGALELDSVPPFGRPGED